MIKNIQNLTLEAAVKSKKAENTPNEARAKNPIYFYSNWYLLPGFWKRHEHVSLSFYWLKAKFIFPPPAPKQSPDEELRSLSFAKHFSARGSLCTRKKSTRESELDSFVDYVTARVEIPSLSNENVTVDDWKPRDSCLEPLNSNRWRWRLEMFGE